MGRKEGDYIRACYDSIVQRCNNPKCKAFPNYGGRGITLYWSKCADFRHYILTHLGDRPDGYSLDRVDNDKGYEPGNLRWATRTEQSRNQREHTVPVGKSGYKWVSKSARGYKGEVWHNGKRYKSKGSTEAATAYLHALALRSLLR